MRIQNPYYHAYDPPQAVGATERQMLPQGALTWPVLPGNVLVDDDHALVHVLRGEVSSPNNRESPWP